MTAHVPGVEPIAKLDTPVGLYRGCCSCGWVSGGVESEAAATRSASQHAKALQGEEPMTDPEDERREMWAGPATDATWGIDQGQTVLTNVHPESACAGSPCVLHNPSDHHMARWPTLWRGDKGLMERMCDHGVGHPDPDDMAFHVSHGREFLGVHGCDGCCWDPADD